MDATDQPPAVRPPEAADRADMARLAAGHSAALNDLMERHATPLFHFLCRMVGNEDDANDLAQETFVRVFKSAKSFRPDEKFSAWLFTIAANLARNHFRTARGIRTSRWKLKAAKPNKYSAAPCPTSENLRTNRRWLPSALKPCGLPSGNCRKICARRWCCASGKNAAWPKPPRFWNPRRRPWNRGFIAPEEFCASG